MTDLRGGAQVPFGQQMLTRHCEERLVRRSSTSEVGSDEAINSFVYAARWIASRALSSGALCAGPLARNDGLMPRSSKRLAQKFRAFQPISPGQLDGFCNADPQPSAKFPFPPPGMHRDRASTKRH